MPRLQAKTFATPDSLREMPRARIASVTLDDATIGYCSFGPGWRWSTDVGPLMGATSCPIRHIGYVISGTIHAVMDDGQTLDIGPDSVFEIPPGHDKWVVGDEPWVTIDWGASGRAVVAAMRETGTRTLATVMFTDIVDSTIKAVELGNREWKQLVEQHHAFVRAFLSRFRGREIDTAGDGFFASFDGPARAIRCATAISEAVRDLGVDVRAGLHAGECELIDGKLGGLGVVIGARIGALAGPNEVLVSQTVKDLVVGSGFSFLDAGEHELKGVPDRWHLYRVAG
jgi:class 3 adenylate cyclase